MTNGASAARNGCPRSPEWTELLVEVSGNENELLRRLDVRPRGSVGEAARIAAVGKRLHGLYAAGMSKTQAEDRLGLSAKQRRTAERAWRHFSGAGVTAPDPYASRRLNEFERTLASAQASGWADRERAAHARARAKLFRAAGRTDAAERCSRLADGLEERASGTVIIPRSEPEAVISLLALEARLISKTNFDGVRLDADIAQQARDLLATWGKEPSPDSPWLAVAYRTIADLLNTPDREVRDQALQLIRDRASDAAKRADRADVSSVDPQVLGPDVRPDRNGSRGTDGWLGWETSESEFATGSTEARIKHLLDRHANEKDPRKRAIVEAQLDWFNPPWRERLNRTRIATGPTHEPAKAA